MAVANVAPSPPAPAGSEQGKPARPVSIWQSLVGLDRVRRKSLGVAGAARTRLWPPPPWIWPVVAGVLLLGLIIWWAPGVLKLKTRDGVIVVENVPESAVVEVDGDKVTVNPLKGEPVRIEAPPGKHHVLVTRGQDLLLDEPVTLESGRSYSLTVRRIPAKDALLAQSVTPQSGGEVKRSVALKEPVVTQAPAVAAPASASSARFRLQAREPDAHIKGAGVASAAPRPVDQSVHWDDLDPHQRRRVHDGLARRRQGGPGRREAAA